MSCHPDTKELSPSMSSAEENQQNALDLGTPSSGSCHHVSPVARDNEEIQSSPLDLSTTRSRMATVEKKRNAAENQNKPYSPIESRIAMSGLNESTTHTARNLFYPSDNIPKYVPHSYEQCMTEEILNPIDSLRKMESQLNSKESHETFSNPFKSKKSSSNPTGTIRGRKSQLKKKFPYYVGHSFKGNMTKTDLRSVHRRGESENQLHSEEIQNPLSSPIESTMAVSNFSPIHPFEARYPALFPENIHQYIRQSSAQNMKNSSFSSIDRRGESEHRMYSEVAKKPLSSSAESTMAMANFSPINPFEARKLTFTPQNIHEYLVMSFESYMRESNCSAIDRCGGLLKQTGTSVAENSSLSPTESSTSPKATGARKRRSTRTRSNRSLFESVESSVTLSNSKPSDAPEGCEFSSGYEVPLSITSPIDFKRGPSSLTPPSASGIRKRSLSPLRNETNLPQTVKFSMGVLNMSPSESRGASERPFSPAERSTSPISIEARGSTSAPTRSEEGLSSSMISSETVSTINQLDAPDANESAQSIPETAIPVGNSRSIVVYPEEANVRQLQEIKEI